jgi:hypothetical protein
VDGLGGPLWSPVLSGVLSSMALVELQATTTTRSLPLRKSHFILFALLQLVPMGDPWFVVARRVGTLFFTVSLLMAHRSRSHVSIAVLTAAGCSLIT